MCYSIHYETTNTHTQKRNTKMNKESIMINNINTVLENIAKYEELSEDLFCIELHEDLNTLIDELSVKSIDDCDIDLILEYYDTVLNVYADNYNDNTTSLEYNEYLDTAMIYMQYVIKEFNDDYNFINHKELLEENY